MYYFGWFFGLIQDPTLGGSKKGLNFGLKIGGGIFQVFQNPLLESQENGVSRANGGFNGIPPEGTREGGVPPGPQKIHLFWASRWFLFSMPQKANLSRHKRERS